jgi:CBS domain-containing protein
MSVVEAMNVSVVSVKPDETVQTAILRMVEANVGAVAVCDGPRLVGIFTERDVLRLAADGGDFGALKVGVVMTRSPVTVTPDTDVLAAAALMGERRIRHLPVLEGENLLGIVGMREVMRVVVERLGRGGDPKLRETARGLLRGSASLSSSGAPGA